MSGRGNVYQLGAYGTQHFGPAYVSGLLSFGRHDIATTRALGLIGASYTADVRGRSFAGRTEAGYRIATSFVGITPYLAVQFQSFTTPDYNEAASGGSPPVPALSFEKRTTRDTSFEAGAALVKAFELAPGSALELNLRAAWAHHDLSGHDIRASFQAAQPVPFRVSGTLPITNTALVSGSAELRLVGNLTLGLRFDGEFAGRSQTYSGAGTLHIRW